jgi:hypothetical protein
LDEVYSRRYLLRAAVVHSTPTYGATGSRSRGRLRDLDEVRVSRSLAPLDAIAGDAHVVRRGGPGQVDLGGSGGGRGVSGGGARASRVRSERPGRARAEKGLRFGTASAARTRNRYVVLAVSVVDENVAEVEGPTCAKPDRCGSRCVVQAGC